MRVTISGIRRQEDARLAIDCSADTVSFLVAPGDQQRAGFVNMFTARKIVGAMPPYRHSIFVTALDDLKTLGDEVYGSGVTNLQLHGPVTVQQTIDIRKKIPRAVRLLKAVHVRGPESVDEALEFAEVSDGLVLDRINRETGEPSLRGMSDYWRLGRAIVEQATKSVTLSGGLNADNITAAMFEVMPDAVDVNRGVNGADGFKDPRKVDELIGLVRRAGF